MRRAAVAATIAVLGEHNAPRGESERVETTFWGPLDRLVRAAQG